MLARSLAVIVCTFIAANLAVLAAARARRIDERPVDLQSRDAMRARAATLDRGPRDRQTAFVGDSLVFGQHLEGDYGARWPEHTLSAQYARFEARAGRDVHAVNLGVNGILFRELGCVVAEVLARRPARLFVNVSPRPFASDFGDDGERGASERGLCPASEHLLDRLSEPVRDELFDRLPVLRYRDLGHTALFAAPPRMAAVAFSRGRLGLAGREVAPTPDTSNTPATDTWDAPSEEEAAVLREMAWRVRAARRYDSIEVRAAHPQAASLRALFEQLKRATTTRVVVFYLEEDMTRLAEQVDAAHFERQRDAFIAMVEALSQRASVTFRPVRRAEIGPHYHDQVHLREEGYVRLAELLARTDAGGR